MAAFSGAVAASLAALAAASSHGTPHVPYMYTVTGACDVEGGLDGQTFLKEGYTLSGAPYYKAIDVETYLYWDSDCMGSTDGTPRWIIDHDKPSLTKASDLDDDRFCDYIARIDSPDKSHPPVQGVWTMQCAGKFEPQYLILLEGTTTSTTAAPTTSSIKSASQQSTTTKANTQSTTTAVVPQVLTLDGACPMKSFLNGLTYDMAGSTKDGRPFYKARNVEQYIYYDADCDGDGPTRASRWVLDNSAPSLTALKDLDQDGKCDYHARLDSDSRVPPTSGSWRMYCGDSYGGFTDMKLSLRKGSGSFVDDGHGEGHGDSNTTKKQSAISATYRGAAPLAAVVLFVASALTL